MKLAIVVEIIVLCIIITVFSIFTIDSVHIRKAELLSILSTDGQLLIEDFFEGEFLADELQQVLETTIEKSSHSESYDIEVTVRHANAEQGIADILVEVTYIQPTGRPRLISFSRVYIREKQGNPDAEHQYSFIRTINAERYKTPAGLFVAEANGGLKEDSIWRTELYETVLDSVFLTSE